jgi:hypothetical protein
VSVSPIAFPGDPDPGGRDDVAGSVAEAVANARARCAELESDTFGQGSVIGDLLQLPPGPDAASKHLGGPDTGYPA